MVVEAVVIAIVVLWLLGFHRALVAFSMFLAAISSFPTFAAVFLLIALLAIHHWCPLMFLHFGWMFQIGCF